MSEEKLDTVEQNVLLEIVSGISQSNWEIESLKSGIRTDDNYSDNLKLEIMQLTERLNTLKSRQDKLNFNVDHIKKLMQEMESQQTRRYEDLMERDAQTMSIATEQVPKLESIYESKMAKLRELEEQLQISKDRNLSLRAERGVTANRPLIFHGAPPESIYANMSELQKQTEMRAGLLQCLKRTRSNHGDSSDEHSIL